MTPMSQPTKNVLRTAIRAVRQISHSAKATTSTSHSTSSSTTPAVTAKSATLDGTQRHRTYSAGQVERMPPHKRGKYIIIKDVPRTALPGDIHRALMDIGAVNSDFPISAITGPPPSFPRSPTLTKSWHLTFSTHHECKRVYEHLSSRPLFALSLPSELHLSHRAGGGSTYVQHTESSPALWIESILRASQIPFNQEESNRSGRRRENESGSGSGFASGFTPDRILKSGTSGRRVVIKGLPGTIRADQVRRLASDCGVIDGREGCQQLPPSKLSIVSTFCLTTNSVADAYRLVRKVHMKWYKSSLYGEKYLMRAEVAY